MISKAKMAEYEKKAEALISQMTLEEKVSQMVNNAQAIERLGIKSYNWWNEALHGVARAGVATVFPQAIGMAATYDDELIHEIGDVVSTEGRAKFNLFQKQGDHGAYKGLTFWAPNVNIFRDPRWGRGHETFGEDPYLTSRMGVAYIKGIQGDDEEHLKASACAKHYVVHSGPEGCRQGFSAKVSKKDFYETYLPAFKACVQEADVDSVMGAYNSVNGEICCGSKLLIKDILRDELGFKGVYVSDCGGITAIKDSHNAVKTLPEAAAMALNSGCDLNCGAAYRHLIPAVSAGIVDEKDIDAALKNLFVTRFKLGIIGDEKSKFDDIPYSENNSAKNKKLCLRAAEKSMTLLKNNGVLPLDKNKIKRVAVVGPNADSRAALQGNYAGTASKYYTVLEGLSAYLGDDAEVLYGQGCHLFHGQVEPCAENDDRSAEAAGIAEISDVVIVCLGLDATIEGEQGDAFNGDGSGDKPDLKLPGLQEKLLARVLKAGKPTIVVNLSGSAVDLSMAQENADAVVQAWYPGSEGGLAVARLLFGEFSPAGRLPVTFYRSAEDLPDFKDYAMTGRTYRYFDKPVLYPFGYGLSYTSFAYSDIKLDRKQIKAGEEIECTVSVTNTGTFDSEEVVQLYLKDDDTSVTAPRYQLKGFRRIFLKQGETKQVTFTLRPADMELVLEDGSSVIEPGSFTVLVGGCQPDESSLKETFEGFLKYIRKTGKKGCPIVKYIPYVNIKQGSRNVSRFSNGNTLPLTQLPFAMAAFAPQTVSDRANWYFHPDDRSLEGIRLTHQPSPWIGDFGCICLMPEDGEYLSDAGDRWCGYRPEEAVLRPDYQKLEFLRSHTVTELAPSERGAVIKLTHSGQNQLRFSVFPVRDVCGYSLDSRNRMLTGFTKVRSWDTADNFKTYFAISFDCDIDAENSALLFPGNRYEKVLEGEGDNYGYTVALTENVTQVRIAISYISVEQAEENLRRELLGKDFEEIRSAAEKKWESVLSRIEIKTADENRMKTFYSCLYRMFLYPNKFHEITAEGKIVHFSPDTGVIANGVSYVNNGFWDTFRTVYPLFSIIAPDEYAEILEGFVNTYRDCGWLPKWPSPAETGMMPGTLIDSVIAHAAVTGVADIEVIKKGFEGMIKQANVSAPHSRNGRKGIEDYLKFGYLPYEKYDESVNATLDYAYSDFCIAQTAEILGRPDIESEYRSRALNYKNLFDSESGFMRAKDSNGNFREPFNPYRWGGDYCEGSAWQNSFAVYHDIDGFAQLYGGKAYFCNKLDELFAAPRDYVSGGYRSEIHEITEMAAADFGQCAISNQPSFHIPYLYTALGQREKTAYWVERMVNQAFSYHDDGFPGDEDNGTTSGWYIFSCLGFYPLCPGRPEYVKGKKLVDEIRINGRYFDPDLIPGDIVNHRDIVG